MNRPSGPTTVKLTDDELIMHLRPGRKTPKQIVSEKDRGEAMTLRVVHGYAESPR